MKSRTQIKRKLQKLRRLLGQAEDDYTLSIGQQPDERILKKEMSRLELKIEMLEWVLEDK